MRAVATLTKGAKHLLGADCQLPGLQNLFTDRKPLDLAENTLKKPFLTL